MARVNVAMEIPSQSFKFEKVKGKFHAEMNMLGVAYRPDNSVGAKFSDTLKFDFDNKGQVEEFAKQPVHYETQFDIASGQYNCKVVFSAGGENFGKIEKPLVIEPFDGKQFSHERTRSEPGTAPNRGRFRLGCGSDRGQVPLVATGVQAIPAAQYSFKPSETAGIYWKSTNPGSLVRSRRTFWRRSKSPTGNPAQSK